MLLACPNLPLVCSRVLLSTSMKSFEFAKRWRACMPCRDHFRVRSMFDRIGIFQRDKNRGSRNAACSGAGDDDHAEALWLNRELSLARGIQRYRQQQYSRFMARRLPRT